MQPTIQLVVFESQTCPVSKLMRPVFDQIEQLITDPREFPPNAVQMVRFDVDLDSPQVARWPVDYTPTVFITDGTHIRETIVGATYLRNLKNAIQEVLDGSAPAGTQAAPQLPAPATAPTKKISVRPATPGYLPPTVVEEPQKPRVRPRNP